VEWSQFFRGQQKVCSVPAPAKLEIFHDLDKTFLVVSRRLVGRQKIAMGISYFAKSTPSKSHLSVAAFLWYWRNRASGGERDLLGAFFSIAVIIGQKKREWKSDAFSVKFRSCCSSSPWRWQPGTGEGAAAAMEGASLSTSTAELAFLLHSSPEWRKQVHGCSFKGGHGQAASRPATSRSTPLPNPAQLRGCLILEVKF